MSADISLTGVERRFDEDEFLVSKTDLRGRITYCNRVFIDLAGYSERELLGAPHAIVRHPEMPRSIFKLLWDTVIDGREIFAYVVNRSKNGDHYWVNAHVTPSFDPAGKVVGYHSNRRVPDRRALDSTIVPLYRQLLAREKDRSNRKDGMHAASAMLNGLLAEKGMSYDEWIFSL